MQAATKAARHYERTSTKIVKAVYDRRSDSVRVTLSTGALLSVPKRKIAGFANASPRALAVMEITPAGAGLWSDLADDGVELDQLFVIALGSDTIASLGAQINGSKTSAARASASRANGLKGGRPRRTAAA
jgi:hypothetical protein